MADNVRLVSVTHLPLQELWRDNELKTTARVRSLTEDDIRNLAGGVTDRYNQGWGTALKGRANRQKTVAEQMRPNVSRRPLRRAPFDRPVRNTSIWQRRKTR